MHALGSDQNLPVDHKAASAVQLPKLGPMQYCVLLQQHSCNTVVLESQKVTPSHQRVFL